MKKASLVVNYDEYVKAHRIEYINKLVKVENTITKRIPRQRLRDPVEEKLLLQLDIARRNRLMQSGDWVELAPRKWRVKNF
jgi:hypothetical protein